MTIETEIKDAIALDIVTIGLRSTEKSVRSGSAKTVVFSGNCPDKIKRNITSLSNAVSVPIKNFSGTSNDLGVFCGKPFNVAVLSILSKKK